MVAGCGMTCIKYIVFAVNFLFFIVGCVALGLGIYALVDKNDLEALTKVDKDGKFEDFNARGLLQNGAIVLCVAGGALLIIGFLGCCGAVKEVKCLLMMYAGLIVIILIIQITAAALAIAFKSDIEDGLKEGLKKTILTDYDGNLKSDNAFSRAFDLAQVEFECCAVEDAATDFVNSPWYNTTRTSVQNVPPTCCQLKNKDGVLDDNATPQLENTNCQTDPIGDSNLFTNTPCYSKIRDWVNDKAVIIIGVAFGIIAIELIAIIFACCLYRAIES